MKFPNTTTHHDVKFDGYLISYPDTTNGTVTPEINHPDAPWDCHRCRSVGVVLGVN